jgi:hypothetical protein
MSSPARYLLAPWALPSATALRRVRGADGGDDTPGAVRAPSIPRRVIPRRFPEPHRAAPLALSGGDLDGRTTCGRSRCGLATVALSAEAGPLPGVRHQSRARRGGRLRLGRAGRSRESGLPSGVPEVDDRAGRLAPARAAAHPAAGALLHRGTAAGRTDALHLARPFRVARCAGGARGHRVGPRPPGGRDRRRHARARGRDRLRDRDTGPVRWCRRPRSHRRLGHGARGHHPRSRPTGQGQRPGRHRRGPRRGEPAGPVPVHGPAHAHRDLSLVRFGRRRHPGHDHRHRPGRHQRGLVRRERRPGRLRLVQARSGRRPAASG